MEEQVFHLACTPEQVGAYVFLPGDPGRVPAIASYLEDAKKVAQNREFTTYTGTLHGVAVSVTSTGIGGPSAAIAMEELVQLGAHTFIRVGTCGAMQPDIDPGTLLIPSGAIRAEGTSREYLPVEFPAVPDYTILNALTQAAEALCFPYRVGVVHSKDSFYGQHDPDSMPVAPMLKDNWDAWKQGGALGSEMESATLFTVAATRHVRCGAVLQTLWNQEKDKVHPGETKPADTMTDAIRVAVFAMDTLIQQDLTGKPAPEP